MKLSKLHECTTTAAIADRAMALPAPPKRTKKRGKPGEFPIADNKGITGHTMKNTKTLVWQPLEQHKGKGDWYNKTSVFAMYPNQDERLLQNHRGHGY